MSKLLVYFEGKLVGEQQLDRERTMIGRKPDNHLQLAHSAVSGNHALVITIRDDSFLEDLGSTNGTRVNGKSIKKCLLQDGDEIRIAMHTLKYVYEPMVLGAEEEVNRHLEQLRQLEELIQMASAALATPKDMPLQGQTFPSMTQTRKLAAKLGEKSAASGQPLLAGLQILSGVGAGNEMELDRTITTLGKPGIQVAVITRNPDGYTLSHLEGDKAPLLNGIAISEQPHELEDRDIIEIAGVKLEFYLKSHSSLAEGSQQGAAAPIK